MESEIKTDISNHRRFDDIPNLKDEMGLTDEEIQRRKAWLDFTEKDIEIVHSVHEIIITHIDEVVEALYDEHFLKFEETRRFFENPKELQRIKRLQKRYFSRLTQGNYDTRYVEETIKVGATHALIGLDVKWYLGGYCYFMRAMEEHIFNALRDAPEKAIVAITSLKKLIFFDVGLAIDTYIYRREATIKKQQEAIRELSTPVLQLRDELLILPIIGAIDAQRARQLTEQLLYAIRDKRAKVVVVDVTGVPTIDSRVANHLIQTVDAARLMGATLIITGLSAEVAQTLVTIGVDLSVIRTIGDLQGGIEAAEHMLGYKVKSNITEEFSHEGSDTETG